MLPCTDEMTAMISRRWDQRLQALDDAHRAERVGDHDAYEFVRRHLADRLVRVVRGPRVDEQEVERAARQATAQRRQLGRLVDVELLDLDVAALFVGERVQLGPRTAAHGADDVPALLHELDGDGVAEAA
jgi:hypothetical protein